MLDDLPAAARAADLRPDAAALVANAHCQPCVGCVKNCYDFNPRAAYLADLNDADTYWSGYRRYFVGAFPGLIVGFFVVPDGSAAYVLGWMALCVAVGRRELRDADRVLEDLRAHDHVALRRGRVLALLLVREPGSCRNR